MYGEKEKEEARRKLRLVLKRRSGREDAWTRDCLPEVVARKRVFPGLSQSER